MQIMNEERNIQLVFSKIRLSCMICIMLTCELFFASAVYSQQAPGRKKMTGMEIEYSLDDVDGDGRHDASIETKDIRVIISSKSGNISVYYLKGANFEENMYPPSLLDQGISMEPHKLSPFSEIIGENASSSFNYTIQIEEKKPEGVMVVATADLQPENLKQGEGYALTKRYVFPEAGYSFKLNYIVSNLGEGVLPVGNEQSGGFSVKFGPGIFLDSMNPPVLLALQPYSHDEFKSEKDLMEASKKSIYTGIGLKTQYFCLLIEADAPVSLHSERFKLGQTREMPKPIDGDLIGVSFPPFTLNKLESKSFALRCYLGPKRLDELKQINRDKLTGYGFLSTGLLRILQFFHNIVPNYGMAIILLTIAIRLGLYPLTMQSTKSMAKVQKIQPLVQDLKDRYKDNSQKFNEEVLKLYQKHNVNPLGGCLPMLLQLPVFFALYNTINIAVELRKTPFIWMADLSKPDPLLLLPVAIAVVTYYQQGKVADAQQRQMMMFMPLFMFAISWSLPSGLLLYWFTSTIMGVIQQMQANQLIVASKEE